MRHLLFIDPLEKLSIKKDSTLFFALTLKKAGHEVYLLFEKDFYFFNQGRLQVDVYRFEGSFEGKAPYLHDFATTEQLPLELGPSDLIHMRIDPPFDTRYLRYLWMLKALSKTTGCQILNSAEGILLNNEKMYAYEAPGALESFIGVGRQEFRRVLKKMRKKASPGLILKPLDLYQGIGVQKVSLDLSDDELEKIFLEKVGEYSGPVVVQPFVKQVERGEIRSIYFKGQELGNILKVPPQGEFLANIAQGATYEACELTGKQRSQCQIMARDLMKSGVDWIAYDILGDYIQEVNITCPGLLVEVSSAVGKNLAENIIELMN